MKKRLSHVAPLQLGIVFALLYGLISLVLVLPMGFFFAGRTMIAGTQAIHNTPLATPTLMGGIFGGVMMILFPLFQAAMGFVSGVIAAVVYNFVARWTGGIEFTLQDAPEPPQQHTQGNLN